MADLPRAPIAFRLALGMVFAALAASLRRRWKKRLHDVELAQLRVVEALESQLYALFDANKRVVTHGDFQPCCATKELLSPGDYEVRLQLRHEKADVLRRLRHMPLLLTLTLDKAISLSFHWSRAEALGLPAAPAAGAGAAPKSPPAGAAGAGAAPKRPPAQREIEPGT